MCRSDSQSSIADKVARVTDDQCSICGVASNASAFLKVPCVAKEHHTGDLLLHGVGATLNCSMVDRSTLAVATRDDDGVWATARCLSEEIMQRRDACGISIAGQEVGAQSCCIVHTLDSNATVPELLLQGYSKGLSDDAALFLRISRLRFMVASRCLQDCRTQCFPLQRRR